MKPDWYDKHYSFFSNKECEFYPCHEMEDDLNCLFCYCPLYVLGANCGGAPLFLENGFKDCSHCTFPHEKENYGAVVAKFEEIVEEMKK